jgi:phosphatidylethanolamine-binding protein (PEBP) family uncharacterized protein
LSKSTECREAALENIFRNNPKGNREILNGIKADLKDATKETFPQDVKSFILEHLDPDAPV